MLSSPSPAVRGRASGVGEPFASQSRNRSGSLFQFRFFETTGLATLTTLIQQYRIEPHPKFAGESFEQLRERYSEAKEMLTLT